MRRRRPRVLGEETRLTASRLPIDRWMLDRLHAHGTGRRRSLPPVAWHGRFTTSPLAEPDFAATPSLIATPLAPPTMIPESTLGTAVARPSTVAPEPDVIDDEVVMPPVVDALALDLYVQPVAPIREPEASPLPPAAPAPPEPEPEPELLARLTSPPPPPAPAPSPAPAPAPRPQPLQEELDPEVRALVDELYQQARAELSGDDFGFFAPADDAPGDGPTLAEPPRSEPPLPEPPLMRA